MAAEELAYLSVGQASALLDRKEVSSSELVEACLGRIEHVEPRVKAYVTVTADKARDAARAADQDIARGVRRGPLHGVPIALKDLIDTAGIPTTSSSRVLADNVPSSDATVTRLLARAGSVLLGKTNTHEFAYGSTCAPTRNPWNLECIPGGSSGGSAAAIAAGEALGTIGTDTAGSIRIPAGLCGVVGLKPTYGRVSRHGVTALSWSLDHVGPITRTVEDAAIMLNAIAGYDALDPASANVPAPDFLAGMKGDIKGLRFGVPDTYFLSPVHPAMAASFRQACQVLSDLGAIVEDVSLPTVDQSTDIDMFIIAVEAAAYHQHWLRTRGELYTKETRTLLQAGELALATDYVNAQRVRSLIAQEILALLASYDAVLTPSQPGPAPRVSETVITFEDGTKEERTHFTVRETCPFNLSGTPALTVPCGFSDGRPLGLQIAGRPWDEATVLRIGHAYEQATDWSQQRPAL